MSREAIGLFLDRDGTINEEIDFVSSPEELHLIDGAADAIREANALGIKVVVVTNQSGVALGLLSEAELEQVHAHLRGLLASANARLDDIYYCPHHPIEGMAPYRLRCTCRKPSTGMVVRAAEKHRIDLTRSFVVGDRLADVKLGKNMGGRSVLVRTGYGLTALEECVVERVTPDYVAGNLYEGWHYIKNLIKA